MQKHISKYFVLIKIPYIHGKLWYSFMRFEYSFNSLEPSHFSQLFDRWVFKKWESTQFFTTFCITLKNWKVKIIQRKYFHSICISMIYIFCQKKWIKIKNVIIFHLFIITLLFFSYLEFISYYFIVFFIFFFFTSCCFIAFFIFFFHLLLFYYLSHIFIFCFCCFIVFLIFLIHYLLFYFLYHV